MTNVLYCCWGLTGYFIVHNLKGRMLLQCMVMTSEKTSQCLGEILFNGRFVIDYVGNAQEGLQESERWTWAKVGRQKGARKED